VAPEQGLYANLSYLPNGQTGQYSGVEDLISMSTPVGDDIYFSQLNVPTRLFTEGFAAGNGSLLTDPSGNVLIEFFALQFQSVIHLGANDTPGLYQFAILSDDGAIMYLPLNDDTSNDSGYVEFINNDGDHPTTMGCATDAIRFDSDTQLPMKLDYYQGPRYEIALQLMWRQVPDDQPTTLADPACGQSGNYTFFDPDNTPSTPQPLYNDMLARGWKPLAQDNFSIPSSVLSNPCGSQPACPVSVSTTTSTSTSTSTSGGTTTATATSTATATATSCTSSSSSSSSSSSGNSGSHSAAGS
jgi:hypothetical protein